MEIDLVQMLGKDTVVNNVQKEKNVLIGKCNLDSKYFDTYVIKISNLENTNEISGKIIGIMKNQETEEERVIVSDEDRKIYQLEIKEYLKDIEDIEKYTFRSLNERSAGAIIYKIVDNKPQFLIVYSFNKFWGFPKGHLEIGETDEEAAVREIKEEVGLDIKLDKDFKEEISYIISDTPINKEVCFFLAKMPEDEKVRIDESELLDYKFVTIDEAEELLKDNVMSVLKKVKIKV